MRSIPPLRSLLFVPADSERKLARALESGADALLIDLEDSIQTSHKARARAAAAEFLRASLGLAARPLLYVRINGLDSGLIDEDLGAVIAAGAEGLVLPKSESGASILHLDAKLRVHEALLDRGENTVELIAVAESAVSLLKFGSYASVSQRLCALTFGSEDLAHDLGASASRTAEGALIDPLLLARNLCLAAAAAAGVGAIDSICTDFKNDDVLRREAAAAARDGFVGKVAIHPAQVGPINAAFLPSAQMLAWAKTVIAAFEASPATGAIAIDGVMYDRPHLVRARRLLGR
jgi:citrate lyase subunit beta/citryl-CoA lyase